MSEKEISIPVPYELDITQIRTDDTNPNVMSKDRFEALKKNIQKYGFIVPVIVNRDNVICDGFHRYKAARELGMHKVLTVRLPIEEVDRRILRQVMNKLRGEHDEKKDLEEYQAIMKAGGFEDFKDLLPVAVDYESLLTKTPDLPPSSVEGVDQVYKHTITCPNCKHKFEKKDVKE